VLAIWAVSGFYVVQPPEKAVVLRFGKYLETTDPGLHWIPRLIDSEDKVNVQQVLTYTYPSNDVALMLTQDQNIVAVAITVQFRINNPKNYLFNVVNPIDSMHQATASALRQVVGQMSLDSILTTGRETLRNNVKTQLEQTLSRYQSGLKIVNVLLKTAQAPAAVRDAFDDAVKAQEDEKRYKNQAQAYAMKVEPIAKGNAKRILEAANAYKEKVVLQAKAQIAPFLAILPEYKKAPLVTRDRLYIEAIENVLDHTSKILVDTKNSNNLLYLPIEKLMQQKSISPKKDTTTMSASGDSVVPVTPNTSDTSTTTSTPSSSTQSNGLEGYGSKQGGVYP